MPHGGPTVAPRFARPLALFAGYSLLVSRAVKPGPNGKLGLLEKLLLGIWAFWALVFGLAGIAIGGFVLSAIVSSLF